MLSLILSLLFSPATVADMGYCIDVSSPTCYAHAFWPSRDPTQSVGVDVYWLKNTNGEVCFVDRARYVKATIGFPTDCIWRTRHLDEND